MTPRYSFVGWLSHWRWLGQPWTRRVLFLSLIAICAALTLYPSRYRAVATLTPADPSQLGLGAALGQLGAQNTLFANQAALEVALKVSRSIYVRQTVAERLDLSERVNGNAREIDRWLERRVNIRSLRGGIIEIEYKDADAAFAQQLIDTYVGAIRDRGGQIARAQTAYKRQVLTQLVRDSTEQLADARAQYDSFRLRTRYSEPQTAIAAIGEQVPLIEAELRAKQVQLNAIRQFATEDNMQVRQVQAEIGALQSQLAQARSTSPASPNSVGRVVRESTEAERLRLDLDLAQSLYDNYRLFLQGTAVEDLTSNATVRLLEPPFIDTRRQFHALPLGMGLLLLLLWLAIEFYSLRPPVGDRRIGEATA